MITKHLDLGCGYAPRNPYGQDEIWGIEISKEVLQLSGKIKYSNLSFEKIPFEDNNFDSVSAYDFLEHIPRVLASCKEERMRFPFIELMNEIWQAHFLSELQAIKP